jgi:pyruvate dehydrogenase E1 component alpha subunit/2-oxoisovalerate dehydrogenase E1 component alpha subunit
MASRTKPRPPIPHGLGPEQLLELYRYIRLTRSLEERLATLFRQSKVVGGLFRSLGQEGESVASAYALRRRDDGTGDVLSPLIRNLGSMLVMGARPVEVLRQYMAKGNAPAAGKELNIHFTDFRRGFLSASAGRTGSGWSTLATARPPRAPSTRGSTSPRCSAARWW